MIIPPDHPYRPRSERQFSTQLVSLMHGIKRIWSFVVRQGPAAWTNVREYDHPTRSPVPPQIGKAVLYPVGELDAWDQKNMVICRASRSSGMDEREGV